MIERIGVTGGIGSGKSRVCVFLSTWCGLPRIDLDALCRDLLEPGQPGLVALVDRFGRRFLDGEGRLNRPALRRAMFTDANLRRDLDATLHPLARARLGQEIGRTAGCCVLVEIPLLFEAGWRDEVDRVLVVYAGWPARRLRIMVRDGVSGEDADAAIAAGMPLTAKVKLADHVIDNNGAWTNTCLEILHLIRLQGFWTQKPPDCCVSPKGLAGQ